MGGVHTAVYNLPAALKSDHPVAVLFASHGLMGDQFDLVKLIWGVIDGSRKLEKETGRQEVENGKRVIRKRKREVVVITLDQRNHGDRLVDQHANQYLNENERHS
jgi:hypothetical protein